MLPERFVERTLADWGEVEGGALCASLDTPSTTSIRLHPRRWCRWEEAERIPWSPFGRYLSERPSFTLDSQFHAGAYYVQEPSSQFEIGRAHV